MAANTIKSLQIELRQFVAERDWEQYHTPKNLACGISTEAAELLEIFLWKTPEESANISEEELKRVADELGDILIYLIRISDKLQLSLLDCAHQKLSKNQTRYPPERVRGSAKKYTEYQ